MVAYGCMVLTCCLSAFVLPKLCFDSGRMALEKYLDRVNFKWFDRNVRVEFEREYCPSRSRLVFKKVSNPVVATQPSTPEVGTPKAGQKLPA